MSRLIYCDDACGMVDGAAIAEDTIMLNEIKRYLYVLIYTYIRKFHKTKQVYFLYKNLHFKKMLL